MARELMYLVDTNVWLERLLGQDRSDEVGEFLSRVPSHRLFISDFAFHSIGVILSRLDSLHLLTEFTQDVLVNAGVGCLALRPEDMDRLTEAAVAHRLDFDDAYHYVAAQKHALTLVTLDSDFDRTDLPHKTPAEVIAGLRN